MAFGYQDNQKYGVWSEVWFGSVSKYRCLVLLKAEVQKQFKNVQTSQYQTLSLYYIYSNIKFK